MTGPTTTDGNPRLNVVVTVGPEMAPELVTVGGPRINDDAHVPDPTLTAVTATDGTRSCIVVGTVPVVTAAAAVGGVSVNVDA